MSVFCGVRSAVGVRAIVAFVGVTLVSRDIQITDRDCAQTKLAEKKQISLR